MSKSSRALRGLLLSIVLFGLLLAPAASTWAGNIEIISYKQVLSRATHSFVFPPANPCGGESRKIKLTSDGSFRITMLVNGPEAGFYWITPIQRGTFVIEPNHPGDPTYWGNFELQPDSYTAREEGITFFLHLHGRGSDGSSLETRLLERLSVYEDGVAISLASPHFLGPQLSCA